MSIFEILQTTKLPCVYSHFKQGENVPPVEPPYLAYIQSGQDQLIADDTRYWYNNTYQIEYYYKLKDSTAEAAIEEALLSAGLLFTRSEDIYLDDEDVFVVYYYVN
jgi:hypothetical protein